MIQQDIAEKWVHWTLVSDPRTAEKFAFRVYPVIAPQGATKGESGGVLTFAVFKRQSAGFVDTTTLDTLTGVNAFPDAISTTVSIDIYAETYAEAREAASVVTRVLHGATGSTFGATVVYSLQQSEQDDIVVPVDGKAMPLYAVGQTYEIRVAQNA